MNSSLLVLDVPNIENPRHGFRHDSFAGFDISDRRDYEWANHTGVNQGRNQPRAPPLVLPRVIQQNCPHGDGSDWKSSDSTLKRCGDSKIRRSPLILKGPMQRSRLHLN